MENREDGHDGVLALRRFFDLCLHELTKEFQSFLNQLLVSAGTRQKVLHVCVWRVHLAWTLAERAFMRLPHKGNFRTFLDVAFNAPRHFLESPKGTFWSPPLHKSNFSDEAFKKLFGRGYVQEPVHDEPFV